MPDLTAPPRRPLALSLLASLLVLTGPASAQSGLPTAQPATRARVGDQWFMTGYEQPEMNAVPTSEITWMTFQNTSSLPQATPWSMSVFYEAPGTVLDRYARLAPDPLDANNQVLHYWLKNAVIPSGYQGHTKGRIQTGFPAPLDNAVELYARQRVFLHTDLDVLHSYPATGDPWWLGIIIQELWSGAAWLGDACPSRINLALFSYGGKMRLQLLCESSNTSAVYWNQPNLTYELPVGEWLVVETGYRMGDASTGRMVIAITRESTGQRTLVFDVTDWTYDPLADAAGGPGPRPLTHWNPQKLYTSDNVLQHISAGGGVAQVYWDDFAFSGVWPTSFP